MDYYDFVIVVDRDVRDNLMRMAEASARKSGGHLSEWERKIRLLCDFDNTISVQPTSLRGAQRLDVPSFESLAGFKHAMDVISEGCENVVCALLKAGL